MGGPEETGATGTADTPAAAVDTAETGPVESDHTGPAGRPPDRGGRAIGFGIAFVVIGLGILLVFGMGSPSGVSSTFGVNGPEPAIELPEISVPSRATATFLGVVCAVLGGIQLARGFGRRTAAAMAIVLVCFVFALLAWAAADDRMNAFGLLHGSLRRSIPIALGALSGVLCERAGVINIAIEGMMLFGAFSAALVASATGSVYVGMLAGVIVGVLFGGVLAVLSIRFTVDQIIGGTFINIFALGMTSYLFVQVLERYPDDLNAPGRFVRIDIPLLSDIPVVGSLLLDNTVYVYLLFLLVFGIAFGLYRTRWGLRLRSVGEHPRAADTVGINVLGTRYRAVLLGGAVAGVAGSFFSLDSAGSFQQNMTAGKGFIALAALIFGRWNPVGALGAALVFGFAEELQQRLSLLQTAIPSEFLLMAPYVVTIFVVAGLVGRARPPAADGQAYVKQ